MKRIDDQSDEDLRQLLKAAGPREVPPEDMRARVHDKTFAYWRDQVAGSAASNLDTPNKSSRNFFAIAAGVFFLGVLGALVFNQSTSNVPLPIGEIVFASGGYHIRGDQTEVGYVAGGTLVSTSQSGQLEIRLADTMSLRMDKSTSATLHSKEEVWLHDGRIYIDSQGPSREIKVVTQQASIVDIGTQFEIAVKGKELSVAVREGSVNVSLFDNKIIPVTANQGLGEVVVLTGATITSRNEVHSTDARWNWTHNARLPFTTGAIPAHDFLSWATREVGLTLSYQSALVKQRAQSETLKIDTPVTQPSVQLIREYLGTSAILKIADLKENQLVIDLVR